MGEALRVHAPGRVNLIGEHTDYTGGLVFPMAIDRGTTFRGVRDGTMISLTSDAADGEIRIALPFVSDPSQFEPEWGGFVAAMAKELGSTCAIRGQLTSDIPAGAGLSSSAALECVIGLALGFEGTPLDLALAAQRAEQATTGVPTGIMDQYCIAVGRAGHATLIDCHALTIEHVEVPDEVDIVVRFIAHRTLRGSEYRQRVLECERAEADVGPLRLANHGDCQRVTDETARRRARHVITENQRVRDFATALRRGDYVEAGRLMTESHASLRDDFDTSTHQMDVAVQELVERGGVFGARMTGGGFGGCVVAMCEPGAVTDGWVVTASDGARVTSTRS